MTRCASPLFCFVMLTGVSALAAGCGARPPAPYTDAEVAPLLDPLTPIAKEQNDTDIVPNGETRPLRDVFAALRLDPERFVSRDVGAINHVAFVSFRVAPSYELEVMTVWTNVYDSEDDPFRPNERRAFSPDLRVYGVRLYRSAREPPAASSQPASRPGS